MRTLLVALLIWSSLTLSAQNFAGCIVYSTKVEINDSNYQYAEYQKAKYGDSLIVCLTEAGRMRKDFTGTGNPGFEYTIMIPENDFSAHKFTYSDSVFLSNRSIEPTQLIRIDTLGDEEILNRNCEVYQLKVMESDDAGFQIWTITVWLDETLKLDKDAYAEWKEGHWNIISGLNGGMYLKMTTTNSFMTFTRDALSIDYGEPHQSLFEFDQENAIRID